MFIGFDPASKEGDYTAKIYFEMDHHGEWHIKKVKYYKYKPKEVKKVKKSVDYKKLPYFETKVVKIKKRGKHFFTTQHLDGKIYGFYYNENKKVCIEEIKKKNKKHPKGNWVNGENLDKIKFPVPCSYVKDGIKHIGILNCYVDQYRLYDIEKQSKDNFVDDCTSLKNLINSYDIHILKGKIIIFENEEGD